MSAAGPHVLIAGAGPAGAALALVLASRGIRTTLVERQRDFAREFRGEVMMPGGLAALSAIGVSLAGVAHHEVRRFALSIEGAERLRFEVATELGGGALPTTVSQPQLLEKLVALAGRHEGFRLRRATSLRELVEVGGRVVGARLEGEGGEEHVAADLVVGADGRSSTVRRRGGFTARARGTPMDVVWCKLPWPALLGERDLVQAFVGGGHLAIALPAPDGALQLAWVILKGSFGELRSRGVHEWVRAMADHVGPELGATLRANEAQLTHPFLLSAATDRVHGWARPGALLIGDAAHTMSPVGGQGLNVALRDAVEAANQLVPPLLAGAGPAELDAAAARVEALRGGEIEAIQAAAAVPPRVVMRHDALGRVLRRLLAPLAGSGLARRLAMPAVELFLYGRAEVRLRV